MCGIAGQLSITNIQPNTQAVLAALAHRGPDAQAFWSAENACLWHARLSIIDINARVNQTLLQNNNLPSRNIFK